MAKDKSNKHGGASSDAADRIPAALKEFGQKAADLVQNPIARSVIAAGLVTAAAALTANQKVRDTARKTAKDAADATEEAAANATKVGEALVTAAADTFRRMFNLDEGATGGRNESARSSDGGEQPLTTPARRGSAKAKAGPAKSRTKAASAGGKAKAAKATSETSAPKAKSSPKAKAGTSRAKAPSGAGSSGASGT